LDTAWETVIASLRRKELRGLPLITGGRSAGARVACRTATPTGAVAVLCLAFPLHPPGKADDPAKSRLPELDAVSVPVLVVQGNRDPFGMPPDAPDRTVIQVTGDHSLRGVEAVYRAVGPWLAGIVGN
jgi:predicted alpha/beta-hydrolase family hydrolase